jgi:large conductance mechanosensitive channel
MVIWVGKEKMIKKTRGLWEEFKSFAVKGNAFELAIAVVIGGAFTGIVNSLVGDIVTPLLGLVTHHVDFKTLTWSPDPGVVVKYGSFLQAIFNFVVISVSIFAVFKLISSARKRIFVEEQKDPPPPAQQPAEVRLLEEIRDLLKERK